MFWIAYNILFVVGFILLMPRFLYRMWRRGGYLRHFVQRLSVLSGEKAARIAERERVWIHAVSVGELFVALRFIDELRARDPSLAFVLTTTTSTAYALAEKRLSPQDELLYFPVDFPPVMRREIGLLRPKGLILVEGEMWPNLIRICAERGIPIVLVNGRLSARSARGYRLVRPFFRRAINCLSCLCLQSERDAARFRGLGAAPGIIRVLGSAKYDVAECGSTERSDGIALLEAAGMDPNAPILVGGSTWPGEERILLRILGRLRASFSDARLVLVPRHFERANSVAAEIVRQGFTFVRRSALGGSERGPGAPGDVLLVDTTGELKKFYACATVIFVGKSLTRHGGQNVIEPALFRKPIVVGPHTENFADVVDDFLKADALVRVADEAGLQQALASLFADRELRRSLGDRAAGLVARKKGSVRATVDTILGVLQNRGPTSREA